VVFEVVGLGKLVDAILVDIDTEILSVFDSSVFIIEFGVAIVVVELSELIDTVLVDIDCEVLSVFVLFVSIVVFKVI